MEEIKDYKGKKNIFRKILPIIFGIISILEYLYFPNYDKEMLATPVYLYFLISLLVIYGIFFIISFKNEKLSENLAYKSPLFAFVFALLIIYDLLTLKFSILPLPYFAWLDMILNSMIADKGFLFESTLASLKLLFTGYFIGSILGIITGIFAGYSKKVDYWVDPFLKLLGPIPTTTWIPVVMVLATSLFGGAVFIIGLGVWFQTTLATMTGIKNVNKSYYEAAKTLGASENELVRKSKSKYFSRINFSNELSLYIPNRCRNARCRIRTWLVYNLEIFMGRLFFNVWGNNYFGLYLYNSKCNFKKDFKQGLKLAKGSVEWKN